MEPSWAPSGLPKSWGPPWGLLRPAHAHQKAAQEAQFSRNAYKTKQSSKPTGARLPAESNLTHELPAIEQASIASIGFARQSGVAKVGPSPASTPRGPSPVGSSASQERIDNISRLGGMRGAFESAGSRSDHEGVPNLEGRNTRLKHCSIHCISRAGLGRGRPRREFFGNIRQICSECAQFCDPRGTPRGPSGSAVLEKYVLWPPGSRPRSRNTHNCALEARREASQEAPFSRNPPTPVERV